MEMKVVNLTPHAIVIADTETKEVIARFEPSGTVARCSVFQEVVDTINIDGKEIDIFEEKTGEVQDLPKEEDGTIYIVSRVVLEKLGRYRLDLFSPMTSKAIRDDAGNIIGVPALVRL